MIEKSSTLFDSKALLWTSKTITFFEGPKDVCNVFAENLQRVGFLVLVPPALRALGVDPAGVLSGAGLDIHALDDPENTIAYAAMGVLVETAAQAAMCPHFGLEVGKRINLSSLGAVGELMRNAPNLRAALQDFVANHHRNSHGGVVYLLEDKEAAYFGYAIYQKGMHGHSVVCDGAGIAAINLVRELLGAKDGAALEILLSRSEPDDLTPYLQAFGTKPLFNADQTAVVLPKRLLDQPVPGADPALRKLLKLNLSAMSKVGDLDTLTQLRRALRVGLVQGYVSAIETAEHLGIGRRTLQRRLDALGIGFQQVLDETRCEFVQQLLANTDLEVNEIGRIVGYSDSSVLTRSFHRWTGVTPSHWRASMLKST